MAVAGGKVIELGERLMVRQLTVMYGILQREHVGSLPVQHKERGQI